MHSPYLNHHDCCYSGSLVHFPSPLPFKSTSERIIVQWFFLLEFYFWVHPSANQAKDFPSLPVGHERLLLCSLRVNWGKGTEWLHREIWSWDSNSELFQVQIYISPGRPVWDKSYPRKESHHRLDDSLQTRQFQGELITGKCLLAALPEADLKGDPGGYHKIHYTAWVQM